MTEEKATKQEPTEYCPEREENVIYEQAKKCHSRSGRRCNAPIWGRSYCIPYINLHAEDRRKREQRKAKCIEDDQKVKEGVNLCVTNTLSNSN